MKFLKQLFCRHLWQDLDTKHLRNEREHYATVDGIDHYAQFSYYAIKQKCIKCDKTQIKSKKVMLI